MDQLVSKRYAKAIFELAVEDQKTDRLLQEAAAVRKAVEENPQWIQFLENPGVLMEEKLRTTEQILKERVSNEMTAFFCVIVKNKRSEQLPEILSELMTQIEEYQGTGRIQVISAAELKSFQKKKIREIMIKTTGYRKLEIQYAIDPSLIGGMKIRLKDRVIDSSIKSRLERMQSQLMKISLEQNEKWQKEGDIVL